MSKQRFSDGTILIGRYEIEKFHASGGMQDVYLCYDRVLNRKVVIKTPKEGVKDRRFKRGAEMGARVNHPNVAATFDYFEDESLTFLVEEFIPGLDLGRRFAQDFHFMDPSLTAHVIHHIARALYEAHKVGICHRDMKPNNVMVSSDDSLSVIKLTDFGIAKLAKSEIGVEMERFEKDESTLTSSNTLLGAVPYMAPECWADWKSASQPMDIWALGCIAYQLLAGEPPFGTGRVAIANVIKAEQYGVSLKKPPWFGKHVSSKTLEAELWTIILACIQVDSQARWSAETVMNACEALCYPNSPRRTGTIATYPITYPGGGIGRCGYIADTVDADSWFFHSTDFFGSTVPVVGQRVSFSVYTGVPRERCSPVIVLR